MHALNSLNNSFSVKTSICVTLVSIALCIGGYAFIDYMASTIFAKSDLALLIPITEATVIVSCILYLTRQWLKTVIPNLSETISTVLKYAAYLAAMVVPFFMIVIGFGAEIIECCIKGLYFDAAIYLVLISCIGFLFFFLIRKFHTSMPFVCEALLVCLSYMTLPLIIGGILVIVFAIALLMLPLILFLGKFILKILLIGTR